MASTNLTYSSDTVTSFLNQTVSTSSTEEWATFAWEETSNKQTRRLVYYLLHGFVGAVTSLFNGLVTLVYIQRKSIRKHISLVMLSMFVFCFLHGLIVGIVYPLQRVYRYDMNENICIATTLIMDLADKYVVLLLPVLAVERLIYLKNPFIDKKYAKRWALCSLAILLVIAILYSWLPLIPQLVRTEEFIYSNNTVRQETLERFYRFYNCQGKLNKKNFLEPIFTLLVSSLSVFVVIGAYIWMCLIAHARLNAFVFMNAKKRMRLKKAALTVMYVALTFIFTMLPFGIVIQIQALCKADTSLKNNSFCNGITLELRFCFSILAHLGNLLAPMLFAWLSPNIRQIIRQSITRNNCCLNNPSISDISPNIRLPYLPGSSTTEESPQNAPCAQIMPRSPQKVSFGKIYLEKPRQDHLYY